MRQPRDQDPRTRKDPRTRTEWDESFAVCLVIALLVGLTGWLGSHWDLGWSLLTTLTVFAFWRAFDSSLIDVRHALRKKQTRRQKAPLLIAGCVLWVAFTGAYLWLYNR